MFQQLKNKFLSSYTVQNYRKILPYVKPYWKRALLAVLITVPIGAMDAIIAWSLKPYIDAHAGKKILTHIDAVPDNFLFVQKNGKEEIRLIDWEYAGMQDPHVDIAMFCIYSLYNKRQVDRLIAAYFTDGCDDATRIKIYCYIAACGLLWSNWCEYKRNLGVEFGEYSLRQYRYAKDYYRIVQDELKKSGESGAQKNA